MPLELEVIPQGATLTNTGSGNYYVPYNTYYHDNRLQFVILASELQDAGMQPGDKIIGMKFRCGSSVPGRDLANFRIRLQNTDQTTSTSWVTTGWTLVCGPVTISKANILADAWYQHDFHTGFVWDGRNLLVDVSRDDSAYLSGGGNYVVYSGLTNRACGCYHDSSATWPYDSRTPTIQNYILQTILVVDRPVEPVEVKTPLATVSAIFPPPKVVTSTVDVSAATVTGVFPPPQVAGDGPILVPVLEVGAIGVAPVFTAQGVARLAVATLSTTFNVPVVSGSAIAASVTASVQLLLSVPYAGVWCTVEPLPFSVTTIHIPPTHVGGLTSLLYELAITGELDYVLMLVGECAYVLALAPEVVINLVQRN